jgi:hypothetical protein
MADARCPLCGKLNPAELEICQFCQARLKPLTGAGGSELEDWLASLRDEQESEKAQDAGEADWWAPPPGASAQDDELPDWLADIRSQAVDSEPVKKPQSARPDRPTAGASLPREDAEPDWLRRVRARKLEDEDAQADQIEAQDSQETEAPLPDWLAGLSSGKSSEGQPEDIPDWLTARQPPPSAAAAQPPSDDIPEWLLGRKTPQEKEGEQLEGPEIPDWLAGLEKAGSTFEQSEAATEPERVSESPDDQVAWIASAEQPLPEESVAPPSFPPSIFTAPEEVEIPSWLSGIAAPVPQQPTADEITEQDQTAKVLFDEQAGDVLALGSSAFEGEQPSSPISDKPKQASVSPFVEDLPEWDDESLAGEEPRTSAPILPDEPGLARAELPSWLEAMRPVESAAPVIPVRSQDEQKVTSSGPLAGLRGVLPAEPEIASQRAPQAYTLKLQLSDTHQAQAETLEKMVRMEGKPRELRESPAISSQQLLRLVVFLALVAAVLAQSIFGLVSSPPPSLSPAVFSARSAVDSLPAGAPVLVAIDYPAGFSGEMEAVASGIFDHLMIKGTYLALVSSQPSGPALAEHLIASANANGGHTYHEIGQYANLGYIPGGTAGLFAFVQSPRQVVPSALNATAEIDPWTTGSLEDINRLSDFGMVIVITNEPEIARTWVEQTRSALVDRPLLMLVSAQAEPVVRPYYEGTPKLVSGILAGIAGGAAYEDSLARPGLGGAYWSMLGMGVSLAMTLIVLFGGVGWIIDRFSKPKTSVASRKDAAS